VPTTAFPYIIGPKGRIAQELSHQSGARFDLDRVKEIAILKGSLEACRKLGDLIREVLEKEGFDTSVLSGELKNADNEEQNNMGKEQEVGSDFVPIVGDAVIFSMSKSSIRRIRRREQELQEQKEQEQQRRQKQQQQQKQEPQQEREGIEAGSDHLQVSDHSKKSRLPRRKSWADDYEDEGEVAKQLKDNEMEEDEEEEEEEENAGQLDDNNEPLDGPETAHINFFSEIPAPVNIAQSTSPINISVSQPPLQRNPSSHTSVPSVSSFDNVLSLAGNSARNMFSDIMNPSGTTTPPRLDLDLDRILGSAKAFSRSVSPQNHLGVIGRSRSNDNDSNILSSRSRSTPNSPTFGSYHTPPSSSPLLDMVNAERGTDGDYDHHIDPPEFFDTEDINDHWLPYLVPSEAHTPNPTLSSIPKETPLIKPPGLKMHRPSSCSFNPAAEPLSPEVQTNTEVESDIIYEESMASLVSSYKSSASRPATAKALPKDDSAAAFQSSLPSSSSSSSSYSLLDMLLGTASPTHSAPTLTTSSGYHDNTAVLRAHHHHQEQQHQQQLQQQRQQQEQQQRQYDEQQKLIQQLQQKNLSKEDLDAIIASIQNLPVIASNTVSQALQPPQRSAQTSAQVSKSEIRQKAGYYSSKNGFSVRL
jgi:hypothetical protein